MSVPLLVNVGDKLKRLEARVLGEGHLEAEVGVVLILTRHLDQILQLRLDRHRRFDIGENDGGISSVVQPDILDLLGTHHVCADVSEPILVVGEEEPALDDRETARGVSRGTHSLDGTISREGVAAGSLGDERETRGLIVGALPGDNLVEDLCFMSVLEDNTTVSGFLLLVDTEADTVLKLS